MASNPRQLFGTGAQDLLSWFDGEEEEENFNDYEEEEEVEFEENEIQETEEEKQNKKLLEQLKEEMKREQLQDSFRSVVVEKKENPFKERFLHLRGNLEKASCPICFCDDHLKSVCLPDCQHALCRDCFLLYLQVELQQPAEKSLLHNVVILEKNSERPNEINLRTFTYGIKCPLPSCPFIISPYDVKTFLNGDDSHEVRKVLNSKLHKLECERNAPSCPSCSHDTFLASANVHPDHPSYFCHNKKCRFHSLGGFCSGCLRSTHPGLLCSQVKSKHKNQRPTSNTSQPTRPIFLLDGDLAKLARFYERRGGQAAGLFGWVLDKTCSNVLKACPRCNHVIEKNGGCSHMHCSQCDLHFTWEQAPLYNVMDTKETKDLQRQMEMILAKSAPRSSKRR